VAGQSDGLTPPVPGWPEESAHRLQKAEALRALGVESYPNRYSPSHTLGQVMASWGEKPSEALETLGAEVRIAGRVLLKRPMGKACFATLGDGESRLQIYVRKDEIGEAGWRLLELVDLGDFIGAAGRVMRTRAGELSVQVQQLRLLSKALLPPPEKWHGLADMELRYRQRYLDLMANPEVRRVFVARSRMVSEIRRFMDGRGYIEVETPMLQPIPGGALARPFKTHHNALDIDLYLRIAPELYLKRLVVGGLERVYEINRNFRNEGLSANHNPEFTMLEFYTAYFDCRDVIDTTEALIGAAAGVAGEQPLAFRGRPVSLKAPFARVRMVDSIVAAAEKQGWTPALTLTELQDEDALVRWVNAHPTATNLPNDEERRLTLQLAEGAIEKALVALSPARRIEYLFGVLVEPELWEPTFVIDYPVEISPLSKRREDDDSVADRFELFICGMEVANGFSELNDPLEQRERFLEQLKQRAGGDGEAHLMDDDYIRALGHGMPPTGGCGVGIDRLAMILTNSPSIRDVILFPHMRPEQGRT
jgi:lysyl-tRNA synthetase class 2